MPRETTPDRFTKDVSAILSEFGAALGDNVDRAARQAGRVGAKEVRRNARSTFGHVAYKKDYSTGWGFKVNPDEPGTVVEIGNSATPGLPHLLEKGHAKMGGGRVEGRKHIAPAADKAFEEFQKLVEEAVDDAIG